MPKKDDMRPPWEPSEPEDIPRPGRLPPQPRRKREVPRTYDKRSPDSEPVGAGTQCGGKKRAGGICTNPAGYKTDHPGYGPCKWHMGMTPAARKGAAMDMAMELAAFYGQPIDTNPIEVLLEEVKRTAGHVEWLRQRISGMSIDPDEELDNPSNTPLPPSLAGWLAVYQSERAHLVRTAKSCLDAGINERLIAIAESQGHKLANAVERILDGLSLTDVQRARIPHLVPHVLRELTATPMSLIIEEPNDDD